MEAEAYVVCDPVSVGVAEDGFEEGDGIFDGLSTVCRGETVQDAVAEGGEPGGHGVFAVRADRERGGAGDDFDGLDGEAGGREKAAVGIGRGVEGGGGGLGVDAVGGEDGLEGDSDGCDVGVTAHFGYEAAAGAEGLVNGGEGGGLACGGDPMECGVGEDGVELVFVGEGFDGVMVDVEAAGAGGGYHGGGGVDSGEDCAGGGELFGEGSVAAAYVEDVLAGLGIEQADDPGGEGGYEAAVGGVGGGVPGLSGGGRGG